MAGLYYYVPSHKIQDITDCGIKLSEWYDREIEALNLPVKKRAIKTLVNPRDDFKKARDEHYKCIRVDVNPEQCIVGDATLYTIGLHAPEIMRIYHNTMIPLSNYRFGTFRNPECLIFTSILPEQIEMMGKVQDIPVLFESSESLYLGNLMEIIEQEHNDSGNTLLYAYCSFLEAKGVMKRIDYENYNITIFIDQSNDKYIVTNTP